MSQLLEVSGVSVAFDGFKAINNLSFSIGPTELRAVIGPNGAGKTTFMDIVTGKRVLTKAQCFGAKNPSRSCACLKARSRRLAWAASSRNPRSLRIKAFMTT